MGGDSRGGDGAGGRKVFTGHRGPRESLQGEQQHSALRDWSNVHTYIDVELTVLSAVLHKTDTMTLQESQSYLGRFLGVWWRLYRNR